MTDKALRNVDLNKLAELGDKLVAETAKIKRDPANRAFLDERRSAYDKLIERRESERQQRLVLAR